MTRMFDIREPSLEALRAAPVYFRYRSNRNRVLVDAMTAKAVLTCYDALTTKEAKAKFERMVGSPDYGKFHTLVSFCWKHVQMGSSATRPRLT